MGVGGGERKNLKGKAKAITHVPQTPQRDSLADRKGVQKPTAPSSLEWGLGEGQVTPQQTHMPFPVAGRAGKLEKLPQTIQGAKIPHNRGNCRKVREKFGVVGWNSARECSMKGGNTSQKWICGTVPGRPPRPVQHPKKQLGTYYSLHVRGVGRSKERLNHELVFALLIGIVIERLQHHWGRKQFLRLVGLAQWPLPNKGGVPALGPGEVTSAHPRTAQGWILLLPLCLLSPTELVLATHGSDSTTEPRTDPQAPSCSSEPGGEAPGWLHPAGS